MSQYRVNSSEHFNLYSMYEHLKCAEIELQEGLRNDWDYVLNRLEEVENLMDKAPHVGALVDWPTLKRIREIRDERNMIRYSIALACGTPEKEAAEAFM